MQKYKIDCYGYGTASLDNCSQFVLKVKCKDDEYGGMLLTLVVAVVCMSAGFKRVLLAMMAAKSRGHARSGPSWKLWAF